MLEQIQMLCTCLSSMTWQVYRCNLSFSDENEERSMIEPQSREDPKVKELIRVKCFWWASVSICSTVATSIENEITRGPIRCKSGTRVLICANSSESGLGDYCWYLNLAEFKLLHVNFHWNPCRIHRGEINNVAKIHRKIDLLAAHQVSLK